MKESLRKAFFDAKVKSEKVHVLSQDFEVRGLTLGQRGRLQAAALNEGGKINYEIYFPALLIESVYDPESGEHVFTEADRDMVAGAPVEIAEKIASVVQRLSGLGEGAESLAGKSVAILSSDTGSGSPAA